MMKNAIYILMYSLLLGACTAEEEVIEPVKKKFAKPL